MTDIAYSLAGLWLGVHWFYIVVMAAQEARDEGRLTLYWAVHAYIAAIIGWVFDFVFNWTFGWMFAAVPRPWLFSDTVQYHYSNSVGWRWDLANFFARNLNVFHRTHIT